ncbi:MAG: hypothetical protein WA755_18265 [Candidatus Acidiferrales bacterium]
MAYESVFETFEAIGQDGRARKVVFKRAGFLAAGDQPELYFFEVNAESMVVGVSGDALQSWQREHRYLSREEKIDVAGLCLKQRIEQAEAPVDKNLRIARSELEFLLELLGIRG